MEDLGSDGQGHGESFWSSAIIIWNPCRVTDYQWMLPVFRLITCMKAFSVKYRACKMTFQNAESCYNTSVKSSKETSPALKSSLARILAAEEDI